MSSFQRKFSTIDEILCFLWLSGACRRNILIIGNPSTGKSFLAKRLQETFSKFPLPHRLKYRFIATDDYINFGYKEALYQILEEIKSIDAPTCIEGVQGYRLLRKGLELGVYSPDVVIELKAPQSQIEAIYARERQDKDVKKLVSFNKMHETILSEYFENLAKQKKEEPTWIKFNNIFEIENPKNL